MNKVYFAIAASVLIAAPAAAQTVQAPQVIENKIAPNKSDVNKLVCERQEEIGSRLKGKKVCLTVEQWKEFKAQSSEEVQRMQQHANTRPSG